VCLPLHELKLSLSLHQSLLSNCPKMHLDDRASDELKTWVVKAIEDISDADSDVLADYVVALIKSEEVSIYIFQMSFLEGCSLTRSLQGL
jgi:hypothetical protein